MSDDHDTAPRKRCWSALAEGHERRQFVEQFLRDNPGTTAEAVGDVLDEVVARIQPRDEREKLRQALRRIIAAEER